MLQKAKTTVRNIDVLQFARQRIALRKAIALRYITPQELEKLEGLVAFLDECYDNLRPDLQMALPRSGISRKH